MKLATLSLLALSLASVSSGVQATDKERDRDNGKQYEVTITNLTRGQRFTPILVAAHSPAVKPFMTGDPASPELATLAEEGNVMPLRALLEKSGQAGDIEVSEGLLEPGKTVTLKLSGMSKYNRLSLAAMLIPTNDAFVALNSMPLPHYGSHSYYPPAYDAGSEANDENCASIPGPFFDECGGPGGGGAPKGGEEGFVHVHAGIHGIGDLRPALRDWRNPVAKVTITRIK